MTSWAQALAAAAAPTIAVVASRLWSHFEHKDTARDVRAIRDAVNGTTASAEQGGGSHD